MVTGDTSYRGKENPQLLRLFFVIWNQRKYVCSFKNIEVKKSKTKQFLRNYIFKIITDNTIIILPKYTFKIC